MNIYSYAQRAQVPAFDRVAMCIDRFNTSWLANGESQSSFVNNRPVFEQMCSQSVDPAFKICAGTGVYAYKINDSNLFCSQSISNTFCPDPLDHATCVDRPGPDFGENVTCTGKQGSYMMNGNKRVYCKEDLVGTNEPRKLNALEITGYSFT